MCFTPPVSLTTAIIEWVLAVILLYRYRKSVLALHFAIVLFLLGFYQFSEFMLCMTNHAEFWGTAAFIGYNFLPAIGLGAVLVYLRKKVHSELVYGLPVVFALVALITRPFVVQGKCETIFVTILTIFSQNATGVIYLAYYLGFIFLITYLLLVELYSTKDKNRKMVCVWLTIAVLAMTLPTILVIAIFPALGIRVSSILCHFALLTAIASFIAVSRDVRKK